jgi:hypothetical protein
MEETHPMTYSGPRIASLDHLDNGAVIRFEDGKSAFFPAALLYRLLSEAKAMPLETGNNEPGNPDFLNKLRS